MSCALPSEESISNLAAAQQSLTAANRAFDEWSIRQEQNEEELERALSRRNDLEHEKQGLARAILAANERLMETWSVIGKPSAPLDAGYVSPAELPVSPQPPATPFKKRMTKEEKAALSPADKKAIKQFKDAAAAIRKANRTPEEQEVINARVAKMKAARLAKRMAGGSVDGSEAEGATA
jgi:chromosome segregation ATPase